MRCNCLGCHHYKVLPLDDLQRRLGADFHYHRLRQKLRCTRCGAREAEVMPDWPDGWAIKDHPT